MNYQKQYADKINWKNSPDTSTPLNATNLNKMDNALWYMDGALYAISNAIGGGSSARGGIISNVSNNAFTTHIHQRTGESLAENELLILRSDVSGTGNSINIYTDSSSAVGFELLDLDGESTSITVTTDSVVVLMITDADTDYTAQVLAVIDTAGGVAYSGLGIGKKTGVSSNVIDTDIDLHRAPMAGDRLLVYFDETVQNPTGLKTYNNGVAVTSNLENATPLYINAGWNILEFKNDLLFNNVWFRKQNVPVPSTLAGMSDTLIVSPSDDQLLVYDNGKWKNKKFIEANVGFPVTELRKIEVDGIVYDTDGMRTYEASDVANNNITLSVLNAYQFVQKVIAINTGAHSGSSSAWNLVISDGMEVASVALKNADGSPFADDIHENELLFVYVDTAGNVARVLEIHSHDLEILKDAIITEKTVSGNPITITDALPYPAVSLSAEIEASQDLHGYDKPWVGGANGNILPSATATTQTVENVKEVSDGAGTYTFSGTASNAAYLDLSIPETTLPSSDIYLHIKNTVSSTAISIFFRNGSTSIAGATLNGVNRIIKLADLSGATIDTIRIAVSSGTAANFTIQPMLMLSDAVVDFRPYSNICPISGRTAESVVTEGKNLTYNVLHNVNINSSAALENNNSYNICLARIIKDMDYIVTTDDASGFVGGFYYDEPTIGSVAYDNTRHVVANKKFTAPITGYVAYRTTASYTTPQCEHGTVATAYVPYVTPSSAAISFGQTVYGGSLNATTGVLTIDKAIIDMSDLTYSYNATDKIFYATLRGVGDRLNAISTVFVVASTTTGALLDDGEFMFRTDLDRVYLKCLAYDDATQFKTAMTGQKICYELATSQTIQLNPEQLTMLKGYNSLSSDGGGTIALTYKADRLAAIEATLAALQ